MKKILITVRGGRPYVINETVPEGYLIELVDYDNIEEGDSWPSEEARVYCEEVLGYTAR
jgi:hypothetical protein